MTEAAHANKPTDPGGGGPTAELFPVLYDELRRLAAGYLAREREPNTLQPTALVHEAWLRLAAKADRTWQNRTHFLAAAAGVMRRILIERARRRARLKHGGGRARVELDAAEPVTMTPDQKILLIEDALAELEAEAPELARVVVLKFYGGMTNEEVAESLGVTERTVRRYWSYAKARLFAHIRQQA